MEKGRAKMVAGLFSGWGRGAVFNSLKKAVCGPPSQTIHLV